MAVVDNKLKKNGMATPYRNQQNKGIMLCSVMSVFACIL